LDELRAQDWVPRSIREKTKLLDRTYRRLEQKHGRFVTVREVAKCLKMNMTDFYDLLSDASAISLVSLEDVRQFPFQDRKNLIGMLEDMRSNNPHFQANLKDLKKTVQEALKELPESERLVLALYYYEDLNLKEIGAVLDVTESRISQIHSQAVINLQKIIWKKMGDLETL
jgi:RNA polymerase sigma factor for flagellar operon FliA